MLPRSALEHREGLTHREVQLAYDVVAEGRSLLLIVNKLDALSSEQQVEALRLVEQAVENGVPEVSGGLLGGSAGAAVRAQEMHAAWRLAGPLEGALGGGTCWAARAAARQGAFA